MIKISNKILNKIKIKIIKLEKLEKLEILSFDQVKTTTYIWFTHIGTLSHYFTMNAEYMSTHFGRAALKSVANRTTVLPRKKKSNVLRKEKKSTILTTENSMHLLLKIKEEIGFQSYNHMCRILNQYSQRLISRNYLTNQIKLLLCKAPDDLLKEFSHYVGMEEFLPSETFQKSLKLGINETDIIAAETLESLGKAFLCRNCSPDNYFLMKASETQYLTDHRLRLHRLHFHQRN